MATFRGRNQGQPLSRVEVLRQKTVGNFGLMMLAFLVDQVQQLCCPLFQAAWHKMKTKCHLWEEIRNHFHMLVFDSMAELLTALDTRHRTAKARL